MYQIGQNNIFVIVMQNIQQKKKQQLKSIKYNLQQTVLNSINFIQTNNQFQFIKTKQTEKYIFSFGRFKYDINTIDQCKDIINQLNNLGFTQLYDQKEKNKSIKTTPIRYF